MSQNLDFGAKSVLRAHLLKKEYISAPFNFIHVAHVGAETLNASNYETYNNKRDSNNNTDKHDETRSVNDFQIHSSNQGNMATNEYKTPDDNEGEMLKSDNQKGAAKPNNPRKIPYSKSFPKFNYKLTKDDISEPFDFVHVAHVGLDDIFGDERVKCETINMIMKEAGVTQNQLEDPETRRFIIDFLKSHRKSIIEEQENMQPFDRSRPGVSASLRVSDISSIHREERHKLTRHLSFNEHNFNSSTVPKSMPPKKPPRLSVQKIKPLDNHGQQ